MRSPTTPTTTQSPKMCPRIQMNPWTLYRMAGWYVVQNRTDFVCWHEFVENQWPSDTTQVASFRHHVFYHQAIPNLQYTHTRHLTTNWQIIGDSIHRSPIATTLIDAEYAWSLFVVSKVPFLPQNSEHLQSTEENEITCSLSAAQLKEIYPRSSRSGEHSSTLCQIDGPWRRSPSAFRTRHDLKFDSLVSRKRSLSPKKVRTNFEKVIHRIVSAATGDYRLMVFLDQVGPWRLGHSLLHASTP